MWSLAAPMVCALVTPSRVSALASQMLSVFLAVDALIDIGGLGLRKDAEHASALPMDHYRNPVMRLLDGASVYRNIRVPSVTDAAKAITVKTRK